MQDPTELVKQKYCLPRTPCRLEGLSVRISDLWCTGGRTYENCVKLTGECFKDMGMWKSYGMFRTKNKDKEKERLKQVWDEQAWENAGRRL